MTTAKKSPKDSKSSKTSKTSKTGTSGVTTTGKPTAKRTVAGGQDKKTGRSVPWLLIIFGVVAVALIAAIQFSPDTSIGLTEAGEPEITGEELPPFPGSGATPDTDPATGMAAPVVVGEDFDGNEVTIGGAGQPTAVVFLAHWCPHCQAEVPRVQSWLDGGGGVEGVEIKSVATNMNSAQPNYPPSEWLESEGWTAPVLRDSESQDAVTAYGTGGLPYWVFLDADGNVVRRSAGELDIAQLESYMQEIAPAA